MDVELTNEAVRQYRRLKEKLHSYIDVLPEQSLQALEPLLEFLSEEYWKPVIETDLTEEERALLKADAKEFKEHPECFTSWRKVRREI